MPPAPFVSRSAYRSFRLLAIIIVVMVGLTHLSLSHVGAFTTLHGKSSEPVVILQRLPGDETRPPRILVSPSEFAVEHNPAPDQTEETLIIENQGDSVLEWKLYESAPTSTICQNEADLSWVVFSEIEGTTIPGSASFITVKFDSQGLAEGQYTGWLCITSNDPTQPLIGVKMTLTVELPGSATATPTPDVGTSTPTPTPTPTSTIEPEFTQTPTTTPPAITVTPTLNPPGATATPTVTATQSPPVLTTTPTGTPSSGFSRRLYLPVVRRR